MGEIGPVVRGSLESHGLSVATMEFPQNIFRDEFGYTRKLWHVLQEVTPRMILPVGDCLALARYRHKLPAGTAVPLDSEEKIRLLGSKVRASALAAELGIPQPHIYQSVDEVTERQVIFKRDVSFGGQGVHLPRNIQSLLNLIAHQPAGEPYLIEDYIEGYDCSIDVFRWDGIFESGCYRTVRQQGKGPSQLRERIVFPELEEYARRILDSLDFHGVCGMDFRVDSDGKAWFLECNPRFTGGLATQIENGLDLPWLCWKTIY